jgi:pyruvate dehydrogenase E2 component (dihydrolipoamide acetyltransferase)
MSGATPARDTSSVRGTVGADHRATDGHAGALFLSAIEDRLADPEHL